ncbi:MAG TPA: hypothetical protein PKE69_18755 [Pyrinomonadaceae bacterium]|nr:hypothetical protein [Pyrinomonadaceae bacterium]
MKKNVISPEKSYTFSDYFKMRISTEDVVNYFGYTKENARLELPSSTRDLPVLEQLFFIIEDALLHISLENEITRREFLIAPVMAEVRRLTNSKLRSEYWFEYNNQLKGSLDYFLRTDQYLLVIEAKDADMTRGFTQLSVEMIAIDKADETEQKIIYGAITTGNIWQFGKLERERKLITQDIGSYDLLQDLETLVRIFIEILERKS